MSRLRPRGDEGFTLIEMVIAMLIMAIAVVAIVTALATMTQLVGQHRGQAVAETGSRSFGDAVQAIAEFKTTLAEDLTVTEKDVTVADGLLLPRPDGNDTYVMVDREVMRVTAISGSTLTVDRDVNGDAAATHDTDDAVVPILRCPTVTQLTPAAAAYQAVTGVTPTVNTVEYWDPVTKTFLGRDDCLDAYKDTCDLISSVAAPECGYGYFRASLHLETAGDGRLRSVKADTTVLLRTGSS